MDYKGSVLIDMEATIVYDDGHTVRVATQFDENTRLVDVYTYFKAAAKFLHPHAEIGDIMMRHGGVEYYEG